MRLLLLGMSVLFLLSRPGSAAASSGWLPHGYCLFWDPVLLWIHAALDMLIGLSYFVIAGILTYLVYRARAEIPFHKLFLAFGVFIFACGLTHFAKVWEYWQPIYWESAGIKAVTAIASMVTAGSLPPLVVPVLKLIRSARASERRKEERDEVYSQASVLLAQSLDPQELVQRVVRMPLPRLADAAILLTTDSGVRAVVGHVDSEKEALLTEVFGDGVLQSDQPDLLKQLENPVLVPRVSEELLGRFPIDDWRRKALEVLSPGSLLLVPLAARGRNLGALILAITESGEEYGPDDLRAAQDLAQRVALALDNATLFAQTQSALRQAEESHAVLDTLLSSSPVGFAFLDHDFRYLRINQALAEMNGEPVEAHIGRTVREVVPRVADEVESTFARILETDRPVVHFNVSGETPAAPGVVRHWLENVYPVRLSSGEILGFGVMVNEITGLKRMERELLRRQAILDGQRGILEKIASDEPLPAVLEDVTAFVRDHIAAASGWIRLFGYEQPAVTVPADAPGLEEYMAPDPEAVGPNGSGSLAVVRLAGQDGVSGESGRTLWQLLISRTDSRPLGVLEIMTPGERQPSREDLEVLQIAVSLSALAIEQRTLQSGRAEKLRTLIRNMSEGVIAFERSDELLLINPAAEALLGGGGPLVRSRPGSLHLPVPLLETLQVAMRQTDADPVQITFPYDGKHLRARISPVLSNTGPYGVVALVEDVTAQQQLKRMQESFVANVSHELRGPLATLSATLEALYDGIIPAEAQPRYLQAMVGEMARLRRLSYDLVDLTRLDSGTFELNMEEVEVRKVFDALSGAFAVRCQRDELSLEVEGTPLAVEADHDRVAQVVTNLVENALKFTPRGGAVRVRAEEEGEYVRISVIDTGVGIAPEHLPHIWDRFYKADPARTLRPGTGSGLGLAIARQLVEAMGGQVAVSSEVDVGSSFSFTLRRVERGRSSQDRQAMGNRETG